MQYMRICRILSGIVSMLMLISGFSFAAGSAADDCGYTAVQVPAGCTGCHGAPPVNGKHPANNTLLSLPRPGH